MKKLYVVIAAAFCLITASAPVISAAAQPKVFSGTVTKLNGSQVYFKTSTAATYTAEVGTIPLLRKYGSSMQFSEIMIGDKVEVKGTLWPDNSISATYFRDTSFYPHTGTFAGKIVSVDPFASSFIMQSSQGTQTIRVNSSTSFIRNGAASGLGEMAPGISVTVKGTNESGCNCKQRAGHSSSG
jgi:hypothetical protein